MGKDKTFIELRQLNRIKIQSRRVQNIRTRS